MADQNILVQGAMPHSRAVLSSRVRIFGIGAKGNNSNAGGAAAKGNYELIGAISSFGVTQNRSLEPIRGIGLGDHIIEMVPGQSEPISLQVSRAALAVANMFQEFGYAGGIDGAVRALKHHRYPVDIKQETLISSIADKKFIEANTSNKFMSPDGALVNAGQGQADVNLGGFKGAQDLNYAPEKFRAVVTWYLGCWFEDFSVTYGVDNAVITEEGGLKVTDVSGFDDQTLVIPFALSENRSSIWFPT